MGSSDGVGRLDRRQIKRSAGRPRGTGFDDTAALRKMRQLLAQNDSMSIIAAARAVADSVEGASTKAKVDRLRRKFSQRDRPPESRQTPKEVLAPSPLGNGEVTKPLGKAPPSFSIDFGGAFETVPTITGLRGTAAAIERQIHEAGPVIEELSNVVIDDLPRLKQMAKEIQSRLDHLEIRPELIADQVEYAQALAEYFTTVLYEYGLIEERPKRLRHSMPIPPGRIHS